MQTDEKAMQQVERAFAGIPCSLRQLITEYEAAKQQQEGQMHKCSGRTNGYGGFTCVHCHKTYEREEAAKQQPVNDQFKQQVLSQATVTIPRQKYESLLRGIEAAKQQHPQEATATITRPWQPSDDPALQQVHEANPIAGEVTETDHEGRPMTYWGGKGKPKDGNMNSTILSNELMVKIEQIKDLDKRRNRSGVPMDAYRDISGIIADESVAVIDELIKIIEGK